ncbi:hypothetical protein [Bradyrhizobium sp. 30]|uniref:hypothetical protein n=1 Tax=Bradyrhizobium sp. 30 TaxID=2782669 RepID=UPI001FFB8045|nr:hypothetical protein [Bradyrhizobium sp. 30]MCK1290327.1 hypothetical protein [Bradyrhizobium sp. 30]
MDHAWQLFEHSDFRALHGIVVEHEREHALPQILGGIETDSVKAGAAVMLEMIVQAPMQLSHLVSRLAMLRYARVPTG